MNDQKLISEYYHNNGNVAKVYRVITEMDGENSFYSITIKNSDGKRIDTRDYPFKSLEFVENIAEDYALGSIDWDLADNIISE